MRKIESLQENECILINNEVEAKFIGEKIGFHRFSDHYPCYLKRSDVDFYYSTIYENYSVIPASEFMQPSIEDRLEALEKAVDDFIAKQTPINNIVVDFENVEGKLEMGKWYKGPKTKTLIFCKEFSKNGNVIGYGFYDGKTWFDRPNSGDYVTFGLTPATDKEVEEALINEARIRYKEGDIVIPLNLDTILDKHNFFKIVKIDAKTCNDTYGRFSIWGRTEKNGVVLYSKGKWATIIEKPKEIDFSKAGQYVVHKTNGRIVVTTGQHDGSLFSGVCVKEGEGYYIKSFDNGWDKGFYTLLDKPITISN